jgi:hypothetical protein
MRREENEFYKSLKIIRRKHETNRKDFKRFPR